MMLSEFKKELISDIDLQFLNKGVVFSNETVL